ncbi:hypothetical protein IB274_14595 [Pseudomonas sp. PDM18]|uniref:hypothetical protein n=1 Tax=Pseudomonas sp. PDM18 TaxID=2769253 RepID=UPI00177DAC4A|nr:hypothetical protein [Pseudomonas sp. PDM18]MBD9677939.1 hypothetical protein [Pseudomonas sp. PDM18]
MIRALLVLSFVVFPVITHGEELKFDTRCFTHYAKKPVNIKLSTSYVEDGRLNVGYVQYDGSSEAILLVFVGAEERVLDKDRPSEVTTIWKEVFKTKFGGEYKVLSQGANIYGFSYKANSGRVVDFKYNDSANLPDYTGCSWE